MSSPLMKLIESLSNPKCTTKDQTIALPNVLDLLKKPTNPLDPNILPPLLSLLPTCLDTNNSNIKSTTLSCLTALTTIFLPHHNLPLQPTLGPHFPAIATALSHHAFGDSKLPLRTLSLTTALTLLPSTTLQQYYTLLVLNNLRNTQNWRARSTALQLFATSLDNFPGDKSPVASKLGKSILEKSVDLCSDANQVRERTEGTGGARRDQEERA